MICWSLCHQAVDFVRYLTKWPLVLKHAGSFILDMGILVSFYVGVSKQPEPHKCDHLDACTPSKKLIYSINVGLVPSPDGGIFLFHQPVLVVKSKASTSYRLYRNMLTF